MSDTDVPGDTPEITCAMVEALFNELQARARAEAARSFPADEALQAQYARVAKWLIDLEVAALVFNAGLAPAEGRFLDFDAINDKALKLMADAAMSGRTVDETIAESGSMAGSTRALPDLLSAASLALPLDSRSVRDLLHYWRCGRANCCP
jgi:hypothetical protein